MRRYRRVNCGRCQAARQRCSALEITLSVRRVLLAHGGDIEVEGSPGQGALFRFSILG